MMKNTLYNKENEHILLQRRQAANLEIMQKLNDIVNVHPELRFTQILSILNLDTDKFYEEPWVTLENINDKIAKL